MIPQGFMVLGGFSIYFYPLVVPFTMPRVAIVTIAFLSPGAVAGGGVGGLRAVAARGGVREPQAGGRRARPREPPALRAAVRGAGGGRGGGPLGAGAGGWGPRGAALRG